MLTINTYDEYGRPHGTNAGRFQYTGQMWLGEPGLYHYKARAYAPHLGRFLQTDPIGYAGDGLNLYAYVLNDPINFVDPLGLECICTDVVVGFPKRFEPALADSPYASSGNFASSSPGELSGSVDPGELVTVTCDADCRARRRTRAAVVIRVTTLRASELVVLTADDDKTDWCGSAGNSSLVPESLGATYIGELCRRHDVCYGTLGASQEQCDLKLRSDVLRACSKNGASPICVIGAYIFYGFVRAFGEGPFKDAQQRSRIRGGRIW